MSSRATLWFACAGPWLCAQAEPTLSPELMEVAVAYAAKVAASARFVSGRPLDSVLQEELAPTRPLERLLRPLLRFDIDDEAGAVTCRLGRITATAVRTQHLGCVLVPPGTDPGELARRGGAPPPMPPAADPWPRGDAGAEAAGDEDRLDHAAVQAAVAAAFAETDPGRPIRTRALLVLYRGRIVAERYAAGYDARMPLPGWSMTKSLVSALLGFAVHTGRFDPTAPLDVPEWQPADPRRQIGFDHLLSMTGGLAWREDYDDAASEVLRMLFRSADHASVYAQQPVAAPPGTTYLYASGATNLLCRSLRRALADDDQYWRLPAELFARLGMRSAVLEADPSGTFVGSSYGFASARDWARLGLLFLGDGVFAGERLLPPGWVAAATAPAAPSKGRFGRHLWLNAGDGDAARKWPELPEDLFTMDGHEGQCTAVSPAAGLVVVRLGCTKNGGFGWRPLLAALHAAAAAAATSTTDR